MQDGTSFPVVVFGLGGIGLNVIQGAKMAGADKINDAFDLMHSGESIRSVVVY